MRMDFLPLEKCSCDAPYILWRDGELLSCHETATEAVRALIRYAEDHKLMRDRVAIYHRTKDGWKLF